MTAGDPTMIEGTWTDLEARARVIHNNRAWQCCEDARRFAEAVLVLLPMSGRSAVLEPGHLFAAFVAGFDASAEGWNGEFVSRGAVSSFDEDLARKFAEWQEAIS